jgi:hypothetical protein
LLLELADKDTLELCEDEDGEALEMTEDPRRDVWLLVESWEDEIGI